MQGLLCGEGVGGEVVVWVEDGDDAVGGGEGLVVVVGEDVGEGFCGGGVRMVMWREGWYEEGLGDEHGFSRSGYSSNDW